MTDLDKVVETIKRNVPGEMSALGGNQFPFGTAGLGCTPENLCNIYNEPDKRRDTVTMFRPLEPWPLTAFHKTLATHIHNATRPAKHSHLAANYGIMDNEQDARRWDFEGVRE